MPLAVNTPTPAVVIHSAVIVSATQYGGTTRRKRLRA